MVVAPAPLLVALGIDLHECETQVRLAPASDERVAPVGGPDQFVHPEADRPVELAPLYLAVGVRLDESGGREDLCGLASREGVAPVVHRHECVGKQLGVDPHRRHGAVGGIDDHQPAAAFRPRTTRKDVARRRLDDVRYPVDAEVRSGRTVRSIPDDLRRRVQSCGTDARSETDRGDAGAQPPKNVPATP